MKVWHAFVAGFVIAASVGYAGGRPRVTQDSSPVTSISGAGGVTSPLQIAVLDAGVALVNGQLQVLGPIVGSAQIGTTAGIDAGTGLINGPFRVLGPLNAAATGAGSLNVADFFSINGTTGAVALDQTAFLYWSATSSRGEITANESAANGGAAVASSLFKMFPQQALDATDWVLTLSTAGNAASVFNVDYSGNLKLPVTTGTAASGTGITATSSFVRHFVHKVVVTKDAMTAAGTTDVTLHVTPANTRIIRVLDEVTEVFDDGGGALSAVAVVCGSSAGGNEYLLTHSALTTTGAFGDVVAEMGAGVVSATRADFGTVASGVPGAITVQCRFTCTGANCNAALTGSATFYVEGVVYP